jgi:hypothetical protein
MGLKALFQVETDLSSITSGKAKCVLPEWFSFASQVKNKNSSN